MTDISEIDLNVIRITTGDTTHYQIQAAGSRFSFAVFEHAGEVRVQVHHDGEPLFDPQPYDAGTRQLLFADDDVLPFTWWAACDRDIFAAVLAYCGRLSVVLELDPSGV